MNRAIRFRAWDPFNRIIYKPTRDEDALVGPSYELALWDGGWEMCCITASGKRPVVASRTRTGESGGVLMQYTGLKDKNGVEIYECDVVNIKNARGVAVMTVEFIGSSFELVHTELRGLHASVADMLRGNEIEVIGNIYENPELLESIS